VVGLTTSAPGFGVAVTYDSSSARAEHVCLAASAIATSRTETTAAAGAGAPAAGAVKAKMDAFGGPAKSGCHCDRHAAHIAPNGPGLDGRNLAETPPETFQFPSKTLGTHQALSDSESHKLRGA